MSCANYKATVDFGSLPSKKLAMREVLLMAHDQGERHAHLPVVNYGRKICRNEPCPCGSGIKYKKCCLRYENAIMDTTQK